MFAGESEDELDDLENPRITEVKSDDEGAATTKKDKKAEKKSLKRGAEVVEELVKQKKAKTNDGKAVVTETVSKKEDAKKVKFAKNLEQGPTPSAPAKKEEKKEEPKPAKSKKELKKEKAAAAAAAAAAAKPTEIKKGAATGPRKVNGVTVDDKTVGSGPMAKAGQKVSMRYIGKLDNGKVFDSNTKGKPFTFTLGKGEVIKGWDIGIAGMQPGGERRVTIPAELAYGRKALPGIPAGSQLTFDGECTSGSVFWSWGEMGADGCPGYSEAAPD